MASISSNDARLNFRLAAQHKALIERAAASLGQTVSDFAVSSLIRAAQETIAAEHVTTISIRDAEAFMRMLDDDSEPNDALKQAVARYKATRD